MEEREGALDFLHSPHTMSPRCRFGNAGLVLVPGLLKATAGVPVRALLSVATFDWGFRFR